MIIEFSGRYRFLSNFYPSIIKFEGVEYPTVEHAFQAAKTLDIKQKFCIRTADTPGRAKKLGRKCRIRPGWDEMRLDVMHRLLRLKFDDRKLANLLLLTGTEELIEGNTWGDTFWGVDSCTVVGKNNLGKLLMRVREEIS